MKKRALRVARQRESLRAAGLRRVQIWVADTRAAGFAEECARQSRLLSAGGDEREILDWLEKVADREGWA